MTSRPLNDHVREQLRALMRHHALSESALARAAGQRQQDVNRFFTGAMVHPPLEFLDALARVFRLTIRDLFVDAPQRADLTNEQVTVLATWDGLGDAEARAAWLVLL